MIEIAENIDISDLSGYKTSAHARYFFCYQNDDHAGLKNALDFALQRDLPILILSGGKNSLLAFDEYPGLVIHNASSGYILESGMLTVASGQSLWDLAKILEEKHGIGFWHRFLGLPGSIGGAVFGNAGCFGLEIGSYVLSATIIDLKTGDIFEKNHEELGFSYRWSECKNHPNWFILSVTCDITKNIEKYASQEEPLVWRERIQPEGFSCGSFFKNPSKEKTAGFLIEKAGFKGYRHNGAYFSEKHANFLMSDGTAKWTSLVELVELVQKKVYEME